MAPLGGNSSLDADLSVTRVWLEMVEKTLEHQKLHFD